jgi:integrase
MSTLYLRGQRVWIDYADRWGLRHRRPLDIDLQKVERRNGRVVWPREILDLKRRFDIQLAAGRFDLGPTTEDKTLISGLLARFLDEHGHTRAKTTQELYDRAVASFKSMIGDRPILSINEQTLLTWRRRLYADGLSAHTVSKHIRSLSAVFSWAVDRNLLHRNPISQYVRVNPKPLPVIPLTKEEIKKLLATAGRPDRDMFTFMLLTGFRAGETCALKWEDVDFDQKLIRVWNAKEKRWDYFPMDRELLNLMKKLPRAYAPFVFVYRIPNSASRRFRRLRDHLKINEAVTLHTLRTNFISNLVRSRLTESEVMHLARHRSIITTHRFYTAFDQDKMRIALASSRGHKKRIGPKV